MPQCSASPLYRSAGHFRESQRKEHEVTQRMNYAARGGRSLRQHDVPRLQSVCEEPAVWCPRPGCLTAGHAALPRRRWGGITGYTGISRWILGRGVVVGEYKHFLRILLCLSPYVLLGFSFPYLFYGSIWPSSLWRYIDINLNAYSFSSYSLLAFLYLYSSSSY